MSAVAEAKGETDMRWQDQVYDLLRPHPGTPVA